MQTRRKEKRAMERKHSSTQTKRIVGNWITGSLSSSSESPQLDDQRLHYQNEDRRVQDTTRIPRPEQQQPKSIKRDVSADEMDSKPSASKRRRRSSDNDAEQAKEKKNMNHIESPSTRASSTGNSPPPFVGAAAGVLDAAPAVAALLQLPQAQLPQASEAAAPDESALQQARLPQAPAALPPGFLNNLLDPQTAAAPAGSALQPTRLPQAPAALPPGLLTNLLAHQETPASSMLLQLLARERERQARINNEVTRLLLEQLATGLLPQSSGLSLGQQQVARQQSPSLSGASGLRDSVIRSLLLRGSESSSPSTQLRQPQGRQDPTLALSLVQQNRPTSQDVQDHLGAPVQQHPSYQHGLLAGFPHSTAPGMGVAQDLQQPHQPLPPPSKEPEERSAARQENRTARRRNESSKRASPAVVRNRLVPIAVASDRHKLSEFQCFLREQICLFEVSEVDLEASAQGRNTPIKLGQVGIICRHCACVSPDERGRGKLKQTNKQLAVLMHSNINHSLGPATTNPLFHLVQLPSTSQPS